MNKIVVITGAAGGIGRAITEKFIIWLSQLSLDLSTGTPMNKHFVYAVDTEEKLSFLTKHYCSPIKDNAQILRLACDVSSFTKVKEFFSYQGIDVLINAAGILPDPSPVVKTDYELAKKTMEVNFWGTWNCCKAVLPIMRAQKHGRIVNISSVAAHRGDPGNAIYAASKAAIESFTKTLALEAVYCKEGETPPDITVNAVAPGIVDTPMTANLPEKALQEYLKRNPLKRKIKPEEVAEAVYFLATASPAINGVILPVDGGYLAS